MIWWLSNIVDILVQHDLRIILPIDMDMYHGYKMWVSSDLNPCWLMIITWIQWVYNQYQLLVCCFKHFLFWKLCVFQGYQPVIFCVFNDPFWALIILNHSHGVILAVTFCLGHSEVSGFFLIFFPSQGFVVPPVWIIIMRDRTDIAIVNGFY